MTNTATDMMTIPVGNRARRGNHQKMNIWTITRSFRATDTLSEMIDELAVRARKHPGDIIKDAVIRYVKYYQENPEKLEVTP